ncbi:cytochrome c oxidase subunit 3 [Siphonobacter aquaeclarae]|uniref:Cytochrome c oxidase subunit 3 n=1 Tax=Siphonobacter aquaeclarae TaxID=563176 RepID=A0A1G9W355_9BACT|nr:cytochrome c oxidase subunit 3 [Siphonobacter aquaeclarae]SDM78968.1 cytochrome c oxidase subunit 3 [Siphonobacter aquaeclarae]
MEKHGTRHARPNSSSGDWLSRRHEPYRFMLALAMLGSVLVFLIILVVYLYRRHGANWSEVTLPRIFWLSTAFILASSATLQSAVSAFKREHFLNYRIMLGLTFFLGILFVIMQMIGWGDMIGHGIRMENSPPGSFIFLISGLHIAHILGGLYFLSRAFLEAIRNRKYLDAYIYSVNPPNQLKLSLVTLYWHFVDVLWILLFAFMIYFHRK